MKARNSKEAGRIKLFTTEAHGEVNIDPKLGGLDAGKLESYKAGRLESSEFLSFQAL